MNTIFKLFFLISLVLLASSNKLRARWVDGYDNNNNNNNNNGGYGGWYGYGGANNNNNNNNNGGYPCYGWWC